MGTVAGVKADNSKPIEALFYVTLFVTVVQAGFIIWDFLTLFPLFSRIFGLSNPNTVYASSFMSNVYLALLGAYAGTKEVVRWLKPSLELSAATIKTEEKKKFKRGEIIVSFWVLFAVVAIAFWQLKLIDRLPNELVRTAVQAIGIMFGSSTSKGIKGLRSKSKAKNN